MKERAQIGIGGIDLNSLKAIPCSIFSSFICVHPCASVVPNLHAPKNRGERSIPGCGAGMETLAALHDGATGGDERRHIASALHRGSEGAQAISINPLHDPLHD